MCVCEERRSVGKKKDTESNRGRGRIIKCNYVDFTAVFNVVIKLDEERAFPSKSSTSLLVSGVTRKKAKISLCG